MFINRKRGEINLKIVYYGPALSGKTTNLQILHERTPREHRTDLMSVNTEGERTLFFDFLQLEMGKIMGMTPKFKLYTVPGQSYYKASRRLVLQGVDGIVFVADSAPRRLVANMISWRSLMEHMDSYNIPLATFPMVVQANKRDVENPLALPFLVGRLGAKGMPLIEAVAVNGTGVTATLKAIVQAILVKNNNLLVQASAPVVPAVVAS
jgi:signal recognition particle receptor subunit beta